MSRIQDALCAWIDVRLERLANAVWDHMAELSGDDL